MTEIDTKKPKDAVLAQIISFVWDFVPVVDILNIILPQMSIILINVSQVLNLV